MKQNVTAAQSRKSVNVSVDSELLRQAKDVNNSQLRTLETALVDLVRQSKQETWREANRQAVDYYNERVGRNGVFGDGLRSF